MNAKTERFWLKVLLLVAITMWMFAGCSTTPGTYVPPTTFSLGFMGAQAQVGIGGYTVPVPVAKSAVVTQTTLFVPASAAAASQKIATVVTDGNGVVQSGVTIPIVVAPVKEPTLAVPIKP